MQDVKVEEATYLKFDANYKMLEPNETYARIQSVRVKNLEEQVYLMHRELQRIRERILPQEDLIRFKNILERLKELNLIIIDLRNHYNNMQQTTLSNRNGSSSNRKFLMQQNRRHKNTRTNLEGKIETASYFQQNENLRNITNQVEHNYDTKKDQLYPRENAGYDRSKISDEQENNSTQNLLNEPDTKFRETKELNDVRKELNEPFKTCKELMDEIRPPGSILGNYLMKLQDFRTDPELRRKRWEKKQQQKLEQRKKLQGSSENNATSIERIEQNNSSSTLQNTSEVQKDFIKSKMDISSIRPISETDSGLASDLPVIQNNLSDVVFEIINDIDRDSIALTIVLENNNVYHISVSLISSAHSLACFLATEEAIQEAKDHNLFKEILTFFVVNAEDSDSQKDRILGHSFEFIKIDVN